VCNVRSACMLKCRLHSHHEASLVAAWALQTRASSSVHKYTLTPSNHPPIVMNAGCGPRDNRGNCFPINNNYLLAEISQLYISYIYFIIYIVFKSHTRSRCKSGAPYLYHHHRHHLSLANDNQPASEFHKIKESTLTSF
jgi:hypothetical protein